MCVRQTRPPGRGDSWILKIAHAPSPKNLSKNGLPQKGGSLSVWKAFLQKNFRTANSIQNDSGLPQGHDIPITAS